MKKDISQKSNTIKFAKEFSHLLKPGTPILLYGTLGVGKTFLTSQIIKELTNSNQEVPSPTFSIVQTYQSIKGEISHFDLYRIKNIDELFELDIDTSLNNNITIIEWPEIIENYIKEHFNPICLFLKYENGKRTIEIIK